MPATRPIHAPTPTGAGIFSTRTATLPAVPAGHYPDAAAGLADSARAGRPGDPAVHTARVADPRHLLGLEGMPRETILALLADAARERAWLALGEPNRTDLAGATVVLAFIEDSTRTRTSFEIAAQRLGANTIVFSPAGSSLNKGETLLDTVRLFEAMGASVGVVR